MIQHFFNIKTNITNFLNIVLIIIFISLFIVLCRNLFNQHFFRNFSSFIRFFLLKRIDKKLNRSYKKNDIKYYYVFLKIIKKKFKIFIEKFYLIFVVFNIYFF